MNPRRTTARIGIYDSGVGGLSVTACLRTSLPAADFFYLSDNLNFPYGTKPEQDVITFTEKNARRFCELYQLDILVIACNTASTVALAALRAVLSVPVVGVVPAIKPAAAASRSKTIALLATPATVGRLYTKQLISDFAADCKVILRGSSVLVELAEQKLRGMKVDPKHVAAELAPIFADPSGAEVDTIVLGCTHFPLLIDELQQVRSNLLWVDSGPAIAARVSSLLGPSDLKKNGSMDVALFTKDTPSAHDLKQALGQFGFQQVAVLSEAKDLR